MLLQALGQQLDLTAGPSPNPQVLDAEVFFGQPPLEALERSRNLKWVHLTSAGYGRYAPLGDWFQSRGVLLTKSSWVYANPCAQHVLGFMLAQCRQLPVSLARQGERRWADRELRPQCRILDGQRAVLVGHGSIGQRLAELLAPFGMQLVGLRRDVRESGSIAVLPLGSVAGDAALELADHVVNLLPGTDETHHFFNAARLQRLKRGAIFYNVGRGTTVDQDALGEALTSGALAAAWLDVADPEPLPSSHPLWTASNCFISPHLAGGRQAEPTALIQHFLENYRRYTTREKLVDVVQWPDRTQA